MIPTKIDIQELSDEGYIAEANRLFFHPLGLALERSTGWSEDDVTQVCEELHLGPLGILGVVSFIRHMGLDKPHLTGVWDYRDDPEGIIYGLDHEPIVAAAHQRIVQLWRERQDARVEALGYMIQPVPGERADEVWVIHPESDPLDLLPQILHLGPLVVFCLARGCGSQLVERTPADDPDGRTVWTCALHGDQLVQIPEDNARADQDPTDGD